MAFKRAILPAEIPDRDALTRDMVGIGMLFGGEGNDKANIEDTLLFASVAGMEKDDFRVLSVLCTWLGVHARAVNADRLIRLVEASTSPRVRLFWAAFGHWQLKDRRFQRLPELHKGPRQDLLPTGAEFQIRRLGEDPRFAGSPLRVDAKLLRDRPSDVLTPQELAAMHRAYYWRVLIGPSYRADLWAALERREGKSLSDLARQAYASIGAAWEARRDFQIASGSGQHC